MFSDLSSTIQCPNRLKAIIKNQVGREEMITLQYALLYIRRRILVGLCVCCGMGLNTKKKALRQQWLKLRKCNSIVNWRLATAHYSIDFSILSLSLLKKRFSFFGYRQSSLLVQPCFILKMLLSFAGWLSETSLTQSLWRVFWPESLQIWF